MNPRILIFTPGYLPGYKAGGPIRSVAGLVDLLGDEFDFRILTRDRDLGDSRPYPGIQPDAWKAVGKAQVYYASRAGRGLRSMAALIKSVRPDVLYLNSMFSPEFALTPLLLRRLKLIPSIGTIVAPRGELSPGALQFKRGKKRLFTSSARRVGLYSDLLWQASSALEVADIQNVFGPVRVLVAPNLRERIRTGAASRPKSPGELKIVFLSRLSPKKNLDGALSMLSGVHGDITFDVFGPAEDERYLRTCQSLSGTLGHNVKVVFHGEVEPARVPDILSAHHLFFFPTHGENFGHVILEALLAGCPVLLSDQTPWRDLSKRGVGWDLSLDDPDSFRGALRQCVEMDAGQFTKMSRSAEAFGIAALEDPISLEQNRRLLRAGLGG